MSTTRPEDTPTAGPTPDQRPAAERRPGDEPPPIPQWMYAFGIAVIVALVVFFVAHFAGLMPMHG